MKGPKPRGIFVYGTLLPGEANFRWIASLVAGRQPARSRGRLLHLPFGYPILLDDDTGWVRGELLSFNGALEEALAVCDEVEGFEPDEEVSGHFVRVVKLVEPLGSEPREAWCYCAAPAWRDEMMRLGQVVEEGDWAAFRKRRHRRGVE